jgi:hypothetical protein
MAHDDDGADPDGDAEQIPLDALEHRATPDVVTGTKDLHRAAAS